MSPRRGPRPAFTVGFTILGLQALTAPFAVAGALRSETGQPGWLTGLFVALDVASLAALAAVLYGMRTGRPKTRFVPAVLVLPCWLAIAVVAPTQSSVGASTTYALCAVVLGLGSTLPFMRAGAAERFRKDGGKAQPPAITATD